MLKWIKCSEFSNCSIIYVADGTPNALNAACAQLLGQFQQYQFVLDDFF